MRCHPFERLDTGRYGSNDVRVIQRTNSLHGSLNPSFQKKHLLFPSPFPWSVFSERGNEDKSFLVKGKALRGKEGSWKQPVNSSYPRQILGESFLSSSPIHLFSHSLFPLPLFSQWPSSYPLLCWSIGCSLPLYKYIATSSGGGRKGNILVRGPFFHYERICLRSDTCLLISIRCEGNHPKAHVSTMI